MGRRVGDILAADPDGAGDPSRSTVFWFATAVGVMFIISFVRWVLQLRRYLAPRARPAATDSIRPRDDISPEDLAGWVESVGQGEDEQPEPRTD